MLSHGNQICNTCFYFLIHHSVSFHEVKVKTDHVRAGTEGNSAFLNSSVAKTIEKNAKVCTITQ